MTPTQHFLTHLDPQAPHASDLALALALADAADAITMDRFQAADLRVDTKPDLTPVSDADEAVERALRNILAQKHPADAILGEEYGSAGFKERTWIIDPIDGTKNFVRAVPVWASLIALTLPHDGDQQRRHPVVGVISAPALGRRWWAAEGLGSWGHGVGEQQARRLQVSAVRSLGDASFGFSGLGGWAETGRMEGFLTLGQSVWRTRGYGDFFSHALVAEGAVDIAAEPEVSLWDLAPLDILIREAGGILTSTAGASGPNEGSAVTSNALLHEAALTALATGWEDHSS